MNVVIKPRIIHSSDRRPLMWGDDFVVSVLWMNAAYFSKVKRDQAMRVGQDGSNPFRVSADRRERSSGRELDLLVSSKARLLSNLVGKNKQTNKPTRGAWGFAEWLLFTSLWIDTILSTRRDWPYARSKMGWQAELLQPLEERLLRTWGQRSKEQGGKGSSLKWKGRGSCKTMRTEMWPTSWRIFKCFSRFAGQICSDVSAEACITSIISTKNSTQPPSPAYGF